MKSLIPIEPEVIGGVDTHQDLHTAAVVTPDGSPLGTGSFPTTRAGYRCLLAWMRSYGNLQRVGVEATGSYGADSFACWPGKACLFSKSQHQT